MPVTAPRFCQLVAETNWIFDFFAICFDYLLQFPPQSIQAPNDVVIASLQRADKAKLADRIEAADGNIPPAIYYFLGFADRRAFLDSGSQTIVALPEFWPSLLAVLRAIDQSVESMSPYLFGNLPGQWKAARKHFAENGYRLNREHGVVVFKPPALATQKWFQAAEAHGFSAPEQRGQYHHRFFQNLSRLHEHDCAVDFVLPKPIDDIEPFNPPLTVGMCPLVDDMKFDRTEVLLLPGALRIVLDANNPECFLVDDTKSSKGALKSAVEDAVNQAVAEEVDILLFPELTVPGFLVEHLQDCLQKTFLAGFPTPKLTLAGSWMQADPQGRFNEAVLLNNRGGVLLRQRKMHRYAMHPYEQPKYGLQQLFGSRRVEESADITPRRIVFLDSRSASLRLCVLICEDLCQPAPGFAAARNACASVVLSPVMAGPLTPDGGFSSHAHDLTQDPGTLVCVANSGALANYRWQHEKKSRQAPSGFGWSASVPERFPVHSALRASGSR